MNTWGQGETLLYRELDEKKRKKLDNNAKPPTARHYPPCLIEQLWPWVPGICHSCRPPSQGLCQDNVPPTPGPHHSPPSGYEDLLSRLLQKARRHDSGHGIAWLVTRLGTSLDRADLAPSRPGLLTPVPSHQPQRPLSRLPGPGLIAVLTCSHPGGEAREQGRCGRPSLLPEEGAVVEANPRIGRWGHGSCDRRSMGPRLLTSPCSPGTRAGTAQSVVSTGRQATGCVGRNQGNDPHDHRGWGTGRRPRGTRQAERAALGSRLSLPRGSRNAQLHLMAARGQA